MDKHLSETGVLKVDGAWVTRLLYSKDAETAPGTVNVRFLQGRTVVASVAADPNDLQRLVGERNARAIEQALQKAPPKGTVAGGELKGRRLGFHEVALRPEDRQPLEAENRIEVAPVRHPSQGTAFTGRDTDASAAKATAAADALGRATADPADREAEELRRRASPADGLEKPQHAPVPAHIADKYIVTDNRYHFNDQTLAFVDQGHALTAKTLNRAVVQDLLGIANARGWQDIKVSGSKAFRREVWTHAQVLGLAVKGYRPSALERAAHRPPERDQGPRDRADERAAADTQSRASSPEREQPRTAASFGAPPQTRWTGTLVAHGEAPYRHDATQSMSYYVTLRDESGRERTHWGVGLADAIKHSPSAVAVGDRIEIERIGAIPVTVAAYRIDANGEIVADQVNARRNSWVVERLVNLKPEHVTTRGSQAPANSQTTEKPMTAANDPMTTGLGSTRLTRNQEIAAAVRSAETTREELQLKYPEINKAVFAHLGSHDQLAQAYIDARLIRESDRAQVIATLRERLAGKIERGEPIKELDNKTVERAIMRSVNRVAADIGRQPVELSNTLAKRSATPKARVRDDPQVRA